MMQSALGDEQGSGAIDLALAGAFILIPFALLMLTFPIRLEYRSLGDAAAREAVRACANARDPSTGQQQAQAIAERILAERGLSPEATVVNIDCADAWRPDGVVTATVSFEVPAIDVIGVWTIGSVTIDRTYREQIELYRSTP